MPTERMRGRKCAEKKCVGKESTGKECVVRKVQGRNLW